LIHARASSRIRKERIENECGENCPIVVQVTEGLVHIATSCIPYTPMNRTPQVVQPLQLAQVTIYYQRAY
jgi:hypothetical protein